MVSPILRHRDISICGIDSDSDRSKSDSSNRETKSIESCRSDAAGLKMHGAELLQFCIKSGWMTRRIFVVVENVPVSGQVLPIRSVEGAVGEHYLRTDGVGA